MKCTWKLLDATEKINLSDSLTASEKVLKSLKEKTLLSLLHLLNPEYYETRYTVSRQWVRGKKIKGNG